MMAIDTKSNFMGQIKLSDKEAMAEQEKSKNIQEVEKFNKALRMIKLGIIDIDSIIRLPAEKRSSEFIYNLSVYLMDKVSFFKNEDFLDKDFMYQVAEKMECSIYK